jgi:hypothetical protein
MSEWFLEILRILILLGKEGTNRTLTLTSDLQLAEFHLAWTCANT